MGPLRRPGPDAPVVKRGTGRPREAAPPDELGTHTDDSAGRAEHVTCGDEQRAVLVDGYAAGHDQRPGDSSVLTPFLTA